jgi:hypothetical protein
MSLDLSVSKSSCIANVYSSQRQDLYLEVPVSLTSHPIFSWLSTRYDASPLSALFDMLTISRNVQMSLTDLPLDVIYVISCHLAGMYAFGTLANLQLASHLVAETVLPVLYETVLVDNEEVLTFHDNGHLKPADRFHYTK